MHHIIKISILKFINKNKSLFITKLFYSVRLRTFCQANYSANHLSSERKNNTP